MLKLRVIFRAYGMFFLAFIGAGSMAYASDGVTPAQPKPKLVFEAKWGAHQSASVPLGVSWEDSTPACFNYMAVRGKQVFIADPVFDRVALFEHGKFVRAYRQPPVTDVMGLVVGGDNIYELDQFGKIARINLVTTKYTVSSAPVVVDRFGTGMLTLGTYTLFSYDDQLIINRSEQGGQVCVGMDTLRVQSCGRFPTAAFSSNELRVTLRGEKYVTVKNEQVFLHDRTGKIVARAPWLRGESLCGDRDAWAATEEGLYFALQARNSVSVYFQPWWAP